MKPSPQHPTDHETTHPALPQPFAISYFSSQPNSQILLLPQSSPKYHFSNAPTLCLPAFIILTDYQTPLSPPLPFPTSSHGPPKNLPLLTPKSHSHLDSTPTPPSPPESAKSKNQHYARRVLDFMLLSTSNLSRSPPSTAYQKSYLTYSAVIPSPFVNVLPLKIFKIRWVSEGFL